MSISDQRNIPFYWEMIRKYIICFSSIFSELHVLKYDFDGNIVKTVQVPYTVAMKEKLYYKQEKTNTSINLTLPRISYRITSMEPDPTRAEPKAKEITITTDDLTDTFIYAGKPWNIEFDATIFAKSLSDLYQIIENIVVRFDPIFLMNVKEIGDQLTREVQVNLNNITLPTDFDYDESSDRVLEANCNFTVKGYLYPPIENSHIIKEITLKYSSKTINTVDEKAIINALNNVGKY